MKMKLSIVIAALVLGAGFMVMASSGESARPHFQLPEFKRLLNAEPRRVTDRYMTVYGNVKEGSIVKKGVEAEFVIEKEGHELEVYFTGKTLLPDTFKDGSEAAVDGTYRPSEGRFVADKVMAKCASKYQSPESGMKMNVKPVN